MKDLAARIVLSVKDTATAPLRGLKRQFSGLRGVVNSLGASFAAYFSGRAVVGFFRSIISEASDLETALSRVAAVTRSTPEEMERLKAAAQEMGATTVFTAGEAAGAMESLGRAGLNATDTISALPSVLALAQGNSLELAQSATIVTQAASGMGLAFDEAGRIADVFSLAAASANTNVEGLAHAFSYAAPTAQSAGVEIEGLTAYIAALANAGFDGSRSGTALQRMMGQFQNPASTMRKELTALGITTDDFTEAMEQLQGKGDDALPVITALGDRAGPALRALLQQGIGSVRDLTETLRESEGAAAEAAATMGDNMRGAMRGLSSAWSAVRQYLGEPLLGVIAKEAQDLAGALRKAATDGSLERLRDSIVGAFNAGVRAVRDFVTSFGSADEVVEKLTNTTATTIEWFAKLGAAGRAAGNGLIATYQAVNSAVSAVATVLTSTITFIARGVNQVIQGLNFLGMASDSVAMKSQILVETLDEMADALAKRTVDAAKASADALGDTISAIGDMSSEARKGADATEELSDAADTLAQSAEDTANGVFRSVEAFEAWAKETDKVTDAQKKTKTAVEESGKAITDMAEVLKAGQTASANLTGQLAHLRKEYEEGDIDAKQYAQGVGELSQSLQGLTVAELAREMAELAHQFREGTITAEELQIASDLVTQEFNRQAEAAREARRENRELESANRSLAGSYSDTAGAAGKTAGAVEQVGDKLEESGRKASGVVSLFAVVRNAYHELGEAMGRFYDKKLEGIRTLNQWYDAFNDDQWERHKGRYDDLAAAADNLTGRLQDGTYSAQDMQAALHMLSADSGRVRSGMIALGEERLAPLRSAIAAAQDQMRGMAQDAQATLGTLKDELLSLQGREEDLAKSRMERRKAELEAQLAEARASGNKEAEAALQQSLSVLGQIGVEQERQRQAEAAERQAREAEEAKQLAERDQQRAAADAAAKDRRRQMDQEQAARAQLRTEQEGERAREQQAATQRTASLREQRDIVKDTSQEQAKPAQAPAQVPQAAIQFAPTLGPQPVRVIRIECGNAAIDAPEGQAEAFVRELQRIRGRFSR